MILSLEGRLMPAQRWDEQGRCVLAETKLICTMPCKIGCKIMRDIPGNLSITGVETGIMRMLFMHLLLPYRRFSGFKSLCVMFIS